MARYCKGCARKDGTIRDLNAVMSRNTDRAFKLKRLLQFVVSKTFNSGKLVYDDLEFGSARAATNCPEVLPDGGSAEWKLLHDRYHTKRYD